MLNNQKEGVNMRRRRNINKEKIVSLMVAGAILATLGVGVYMVTNTVGSKPDNNIVDLNETEAPNVAFRSEEPTENVYNSGDGSVSGDSQGNSVEKEASKKDDAEKQTEDGYYNDEEIAQIYDEIGTQSETESDKDSDKGNAAVNAPAIVDPAAAYTFSEDSSLLWPVKGDIILKYSMDSTILFKTLGVYKCNPAILIGANVGANVGVAADGVVIGTKKSEETGVTVSVAIGGGYVVTYGQLSDVVVKAGDKVTKGQLLGTVAEPTAYYVEEGAHIYFAVTKDDIPVNPSDFLE